ncbi:hypothetical protein [Citrobacter portucalensis]|nr:hypothetical protein [Citrobacter portucalensis]MEB2744137.1 hypothetical protein [Citrobacter portucalensis]
MKTSVEILESVAADIVENTSLLNELCFMTQMTMENTSKGGGNNDVSER